MPRLRAVTQLNPLMLGLAAVMLVSGCSRPSGANAPLPGAAQGGANPTLAAAPAAQPASAAGASSVSACPPAGSTTKLDGAGATFPAPLYSRWFSEYNTLCKIEINYQSIGSGGGIAQHTAKTVSFGASDGILTQAQKDAAPNTLMIPMVAGAEALVVNLPGIQHGQLRLTPATLAGIYLGEITKWNDPKLRADNPNVNLPDLDVIVVHRSDGSGTTNIFTTYLAAVSPTWKDRVGAGNSVEWPTGLGGQGNEGVAGQVRQLPGGIGYVELAYAKQNNMTWAALQNKSGRFVEPSLEAATAAMEGVQIPESTEVMIVDSANPNAFPITGFTWMLVYRDIPDPAVAKSVAHVLWWALHDGQRFASALDYSPLSPAAQTAAEAQIKKITAGGAPALS